MKTTFLAGVALLALTPAYAGGSNAGSKSGSGAVAISGSTNVNRNSNVNINQNRNTNINRNTAVGLGVGISNVKIKITTGGGGGGGGALAPISMAPLPFNQVPTAQQFLGSAPGAASAFVLSPTFTPAVAGNGNPGGGVPNVAPRHSLPEVTGSTHLVFHDGSNLLRVAFDDKTIDVRDTAADGTEYDRFTQYEDVKLTMSDHGWTWRGRYVANPAVSMTGTLVKTDKGYFYEETQTVGAATRVFTPGSYAGK